MSQPEQQLLKCLPLMLGERNTIEESILHKRIMNLPKTSPYKPKPIRNNEAYYSREQLEMIKKELADELEFFGYTGV